nr:MAG TPA: hypothetical protein [Caudoviricetes sp.]
MPLDIMIYGHLDILLVTLRRSVNRITCLLELLVKI